MVIREQDKHFLWSLCAGVAVIFLWKGLWEGLYEIPYVGGNPFFWFALGFGMLTFSGVIFKEFDPLGGLEKAVNKNMHTIFNHPQQKEFTIKYYDMHQKKEILISAARIKNIERGALVVQHKNGKQELFIPIHRVTEILFKGKPYWRL